MILVLKHTIPHSKYTPGEDDNISAVLVFLDMQVSLAPTHVSKSVSKSVGHTFGFLISGRHTTSAALS